MLQLVGIYEGGTLPAAARARWPILSACRWFVTMAAREELYSQEDNESSRQGALLEGAVDLAYRGIMPRVLRQALCAAECAHAVPASPGSEEEFATGREIDAAEAEAAEVGRRRGSLPNSVRITTVLVAGLRRLRWEYARLTDAWCNLRVIRNSLNAADPWNTLPIRLNTFGHPCFFLRGVRLF